MVTSLAKFALDTSHLQGSFLLLVCDMCGRDCQVVLELAAGGEVDCDRVLAPREHNGLVDSIQLVLQGSCGAS